MAALNDLLIAEITRKKSLNIMEYMDFCLYHPKHGYYITRDPLGKAGDFTTAPEISQLFGEVLALWVVQQWQRLNSPQSFALLELGPGRGTLMSDMLRTLQQVAPQCYAAAQVYLMEISPKLRKKQQELLQNHHITHINSLENLQDSLQIITIANEFLDALPIRQFERQKSGEYFERVVVLDPQQNLTFSTAPALTKIDGDLAIIEQPDAMVQFLRKLKALPNLAAALFIDYGYTAPSVDATGDSLQALQNHQVVNVLTAPGECDLTSHVNFNLVSNTLGVKNCAINDMTEFLLQHGIAERALQLIDKADTSAQKIGIESGLQRLLHPNQMGQLFKVLAYSS